MSTFKTTPGAIVSILVSFGMLAFTIYRLIICVNKQEANVSKQSFMRDLDTEDPLYPNQYGFEMAFGQGVPMDRSIGYYSASMVSFNYVKHDNGTQSRVKSK